MTEVRFHDAIFDVARFDPESALLYLRILCLDGNGGYEAADLTYSGAATDLETIQSLSEDLRIEALFSEVHKQPEGLYEHHWLLWPYKEFVISFRDVTVSRNPIEDRTRAPQIGA
jgi:hypothetical protein